MTEDRGRAERARALLETCGMATDGMAPAEAVRRADEVAEAAAAYAGRAAEAEAAVFDEHMRGRVRGARRHRPDDARP